MFRRHYKQMFFSSISSRRKLKYQRLRRLSTVLCASQYRNLSPVPSPEDVVQHSIQASIWKMQLVTESLQRGTLQKENRALEGRSKLEERYPSDASYRKT
jgi:hypothetical protein